MRSTLDSRYVGNVDQRITSFLHFFLLVCFSFLVSHYSDLWLESHAIELPLKRILYVGLLSSRKFVVQEFGVKRGRKRTDEEGHIPKGERKRVEQSKSDRIKASYTLQLCLVDSSGSFLRCTFVLRKFQRDGQQVGEKFRYGHPVIALRNSLEGRFRNCRTNNLTVILVPCESFRRTFGNCPILVDTSTLIKIVNIFSTKVSISVRRWSFQFLEWRKSTKGRVVRVIEEGVGSGGVRGDKGDEYGKRKRRVMVD
ncbi:hypothetical protein V1478_009313, partial [Vespula squamosa]